MSHRKRLVLWVLFAASGATVALGFNLPVGESELGVYRGVLRTFEFEAIPRAVENRTDLLGHDLRNRLGAGACFRQVEVGDSLIDVLERANLLRGKLYSGAASQLGVSLSWEHGWLKSLARWATGFEPSECEKNHLRFSRVAFTQDGALALVSADFHCSFCGYEGFFLLRLSEGEWKVIDHCTVLVS